MSTVSFTDNKLTTFRKLPSESTSEDNKNPPYIVVKGWQDASKDDEMRLSFQFGIIVKSIEVGHKERIQEIPTVGNEYFLYVLGNSPYNFTVSGYCVTLSDRSTDGRSNILDFYESLRLSNNPKGTLVYLKVGKSTFYTWMTGMQFQGDSTEIGPIYNFSITFSGFKSSNTTVS